MHVLALAALAFLAADAGAAGPVPPRFAVGHVRTAEPVVALTFDACATKKQANGFDRPLYEILKREQIPVTMFLSGRWIKTHNTAARELAAEPWIEIGNHSYSHPRMSLLRPERAREQLRATNRMIEKLGRTPTLYRPPAGAWNGASVRMAAGQGLTTIAWDVPSGDAGGHLRAPRIVKGVLDAAKPGSIVVFHINRRAPFARSALPEVIRELRERGFRFATVSQLLALPDAQPMAAKLTPYGVLRARSRRKTTAPVPEAS